MTTLTEGNRNQEWLMTDNAAYFSRESATLISGQNLRSGTVLGKITASGKYTILAPAAGDGSQNAAAILLTHTDASGGDKRTAVIEGNPGVAVQVNSNLLTWPGGITGPQKTTAIAALKALGIKVR
jgi:hypothetical protein